MREKYTRMYIETLYSTCAHPLLYETHARTRSNYLTPTSYPICTFESPPQFDHAYRETFARMDGTQPWYSPSERMVQQLLQNPRPWEMRNVVPETPYQSPGVEPARKRRRMTEGSSYDMAPTPGATRVREPVLSDEDVQGIIDDYRTERIGYRMPDSPEVSPIRPAGFSLAGKNTQAITPRLRRPRSRAARQLEFEPRASPAESIEESMERSQFEQYAQEEVLDMVGFPSTNDEDRDIFGTPAPEAMEEEEEGEGGRG